MVLLLIVLAGVSFVVSAGVCAGVLRVSRRAGLLDQAGAEAHKNHARSVPNTGGVGIAAAVLVPMLVLLGAVRVIDPAAHPDHAELIDGARSVWVGGAVLVGCLLVMHLVGVIDDRRPLPPGIKLAAQVLAAAALTAFADMRVLQVLDDAVPGGVFISGVVSVLWIVTVTNAFNMLDNMDGLSAGVGAIASAIFLAAAVITGQWFVGGAAALLLGALAGFLLFNFPPAKLFMGDGGSLVLGMLVAVVAIRTTYVPPPEMSVEGARAANAGEGSGAGVFMGLHGVLAPLVVLAVPLYDLCSVVLIRLRQGAKPWVGDNQHFSHRLVMLGLSRRRAVGVIWLAAAATGLGGVVMGRLPLWGAVLVAGASAAVVGMLALLEHGALRGRGGR